MTRIEEAYRIVRSIERGEPQPTALEKERAYWEQKAAQAESLDDLMRIRRLYESRPRIY